MNKLGFLASEAKMCSGSLTNPSSKFGITRCKKEKTAYFGNEKCLDNKVGNVYASEIKRLGLNSNKNYIILYLWFCLKL